MRYSSLTFISSARDRYKEGDVPRIYDSFHQPSPFSDAIQVPGHLDVMKSTGIPKRSMGNLRIEYAMVYFHRLSDGYWILDQA